MDKTIETLRQLFEVLCRIQSSAWLRQQPKWEPSTQAVGTWRLLVGSWSPIEEKEINNLFRDPEKIKIDFSDHKKVLYLPPLEKNAQFVPVLSLKCDLNETITNVRLRIMLVKRKDSNEKLYGIGFRLESPESGQQNNQNAIGDRGRQEGRHDFFHAQLIQSLGWGPSIECPDWIPEAQPSFPLAANCPVTLLLCLLLSLYGKRYCWTFVTEHHVFSLESYLKEIDAWYNRASATK